MTGDAMRFKHAVSVVLVPAMLAACGPDGPTRQDTGLAVGAVAGGILGNQVGRGTGKVVATVAGAVIGGTSLLGGVGTVIGGFLGVTVLVILQVGFNIIGVSAFDFDLITGLAILASMILNVQVARLKNLGRLQ
jgi:ribose/xylose/arabinose/galactoside ABC-type transport system permease subunit